MAAVTLFIDEDVHEGLAAALQKRGIDAVNARECGRKGAKDAEQLAFAVSQQRALMTFNIADFEALVRQAKLGASCGVKVPAEEGLTNHSYRVLQLWRKQRGRAERNS